VREEIEALVKERYHIFWLKKRIVDMFLIVAVL
jgi:hypothetical protein